MMSLYREVRDVKEFGVGERMSAKNGCFASNWTVGLGGCSFYMEVKPS